MTLTLVCGILLVILLIVWIVITVREKHLDKQDMIVDDFFHGIFDISVVMSDGTTDHYGDSVNTTVTDNWVVVELEDGYVSYPREYVKKVVTMSKDFDDDED